MIKKVLAISYLILILFSIPACMNNPITGKKESRTDFPSPPPVRTAAPAPAPTEPAKTTSLRFVVMADSRGDDNGINSQSVKRTLAQIQMLFPQPAFAIMPGDLVDGGKSFAQTKAQLEYFKKTITQFYPIEFFYPGLGNHEVLAGSEGEKAFQQVFSEFQASFLEGYSRTVYFFDRASVRFFMLNSNHPGERHIVSDTQLNWIKQNSGTNRKHTLYFVHEPPYPTGAHIGSSLDSNKLQRDKFWELVDRSVGPMLFCGHEHNYTRRHIDSSFNENAGGISFAYERKVYQVTTGSFGAPFYKDFKDKKNVDVPPMAQYHFAVVDVDDRKLKVTVLNMDGQVIDTFEQSSPE